MFHAFSSSIYVQIHCDVLSEARGLDEDKDTFQMNYTRWTIADEAQR